MSRSKKKRGPRIEQYREDKLRTEMWDSDFLEAWSKILGNSYSPRVCNIFVSWMFLPSANWLKKNKRPLRPAKERETDELLTYSELSLEGKRGMRS